MTDATIKTALVIEGGGIRGSFAAGVLSEMHRQGVVNFDAVYGTSAGAACGAYFVAGQIDLAVTVWKDRTYGRHLVSVRNLLRGVPAMDVEGLVDTFRNGRRLDTEKVAESPSELYISMTRCDSGRTEYVRATKDNVLDALHASMALPVAYGRVVDFRGNRYVDGGIADPIPFRQAVARGAERITVILTQPRGYQKKFSRVGQLALEMNLRDYPNVWMRSRERAALYNEQLAKLDELERQGRAHIIRPAESLPTSRISRDRTAIIRTIDAGREAARRAFGQRATGS